MAAVGSHVPFGSPVLCAEHHEHKDGDKSHSRNKRPTRVERIRRGRQRDKARLQSLREQLATSATSSASSASEDRPLPDDKEFRLQIAKLKIKLSFSVHRQAALAAACDAAYATCWKFKAAPAFAHALSLAISSAIHHLASSDAYTLVVPSAPTCTGCPSSGPAAFDIFEAEDSMWTTPGQVFPDAGIRESMPTPDRTCESSVEASGIQPLVTAHADAAAGLAAAHVYTGASQEADGPLVTGQRQALDGDNSEHRCASGNGITFQDDPLVQPQCGRDFNSQDLASSPEPVAVHRVAGSKDFISQDLAPSPRLNLRQALDVGNSEHRNSNSSEFSLKDQNPTPLVEGAISQVNEISQQARDPLVQSQYGRDFNSQDLASSPEPVTVHQVAGSKDFNSQNLALVQPQCGRDYNSQDLASSPEPVAVHRVAGSKDFNSQDLAPSPGLSLRQALDVGNSEHRNSSSSEFSLKDQHPTPLVECAVSQVYESSQQALDPLVQSQHERDFNSQDLASSPWSVAVFRVAGSKDFNSQDLAPFPGLSLRQALEDGNSEHRNSSTSEISLKDYQSQHCAFPAGPAAFETAVQSAPQVLDQCSQDLANTTHVLADNDPAQSGRLPTDQQKRQVLEYANSEHRMSSLEPLVQSPCGLDFNSQNLAFPSESVALHPFDGSKDDNSQGHAHSPEPRLWQALDVGNSEHHIPSSREMNFGPSTRELQKPLRDYTLLVAPIIGAYCKRRNPSLGHIRATAAKVLRIAKKHGLSKEHCCQHLRESSLALMTAASDLW